MKDTKTQRAVFAAGCFWGVEAAFQNHDGVISTRAGYSGGHTENPNYRQVCSGRTGHAESVEILFDPDRIRYEDLLEIFWNCHDPTQLNRQGPDVGSQYRSVIFHADESQQKAAKASLDNREETGGLRGRIVTEIIPAAAFFPAEEYHQQYLEKRGRGFCHY